MNKLIILCFVAFVVGSCRYEETRPSMGYVTWSFNQNIISGGRIHSNDGIAAVISIRDHQGKIVYENRKLSLMPFGQGYVTESLQLSTGNFTLTSFAIINSKDEIVYASPLENSDKAKWVSDPLPIAFTIVNEKTTQVVPEVLMVNSQDTPESFGYTSFGYKVITAHITPILVQVKLLVGEFLYEDIETTIQVKGFDVNGNEKSSRAFPYAGYIKKSLPIDSGYSHYTISMEKWGVTDTQTITAQELFDSRADGPLPTTYVLGGKVSIVKKPIFSLDYWEEPDHTFPVRSRIEYEYNSTGKLKQMTFFEEYSSNAAAQVPTRYRVFSYSGETGGLLKLTEYLSSNNQVLFEDTYEYGIDGILLRITETRAGMNGPITGTMSLRYDANNILGKASYQYSNGRGFDYEFDFYLKNIVDDKTTEGVELCNHGAYSYDRNINPFKHMGYVSYLLDNYSANNKLTEDVQYIACGFPSLIPESYSYTYDNLGYPMEKITHYKGKTQISATKYYYQEFPQ